MSYRQRAEHRVLRAIGSTTGLIIIALALGLAIAAALGAIAWGIASALHHASTS